MLNFIVFKALTVYRVWFSIRTAGHFQFSLNRVQWLYLSMSAEVVFPWLSLVSNQQNEYHRVAYNETVLFNNHRSFG